MIGLLTLEKEGVRRRPTSSHPVWSRSGLARRGPLAAGCRQPEGDAKLAKQFPRLFVVVGRGHDGDVHALRVLKLVGVDLREDDLLGQSQAEIAMTVKAVGVNAAKVANTRQGNRDQTIEKLVHPPAAQGDLAAD